MDLWKLILLVSTCSMVDASMVMFQGSYEGNRCTQQAKMGSNFTLCVYFCEKTFTCQMCYSSKDICYHCGQVVSLTRIPGGSQIGLKISENYTIAENICSTYGGIKLADTTTPSQPTST
ncbi:unnamed protein product [Caenorhabditis brenneri]